jgi:hypothetical protein
MNKKIMCIGLIGMFVLLSLNFGSAENIKDTKLEANNETGTFIIMVTRPAAFENYYSDATVTFQNTEDENIKYVLYEANAYSGIGKTDYKQEVIPGTYKITAQSGFRKGSETLTIAAGEEIEEYVWITIRYFIMDLLENLFK